MRKPPVHGIAGYESGKEIRQTSHLTVLRSNLKLYHRGSLKLSAVLLCKLEASLGSTLGAWLYPRTLLFALLVIENDHLSTMDGHRIRQDFLFERGAAGGYSNLSVPPMGRYGSESNSRCPPRPAVLFEPSDIEFTSLLTGRAPKTHNRPGFFH